MFAVGFWTVIAIEEVFEASACATPVTVTLAGLGSVVARYEPVVEIVPVLADPPATPFTSHVRQYFVVPETVAVNCSGVPHGGYGARR